MILNRNLLSTLTCAAITISLAPAAAEVPRPNIIVILSDDVGFSDLGCYGGEVDTPNLDALAKDGVRFTQFYNTARCCPTRASLLTGTYPHQAGMGHMTVDRGNPGYRGDLNKQTVLISEVLKDANYRTYAIGKWHVSRSGRPNGPQHNWPLQRGFDKYYGTIWGAISYWDPGICRGNTWYSHENDPEYQVDDYYFTDALSDNAVNFLKKHQQESPDKPFFMYVAYTAAHWPLMARERDIEKYKGRFDAGYDKLRRQRLERMQKMKLIDPKWELSPTIGDWGKVENREWELRCMEVYAAMLDSMDQGIGRIANELKRQDIFDNTLILYMQDNGACAEEIGRQPELREAEGNFKPLRPDQIPSGGQPRQTRDGRPMRSGVGAMPGGEDVYIGYGEKWANVSNTPFREYKHWVHEGGIATPLIAHWPKGITTSLRDQLIHQPSHLIDIMATCVDLAGATYPTQRDKEKIVPMQGVSLRPLFEGKSLQRGKPIFWEHEGNRAVRDGKWKLVAKENEPWELYDMETDRTEMNNLAADQPDLVKKLAAKWDEYAATSNVHPLGGWRHEPVRQQQPRVTLKQNDVLDGGDSPQAGDRSVTATVALKGAPTDGVLAAQGGDAHGYALYISEGKLTFAVRQRRKLKKVSVEEALPESTKEVRAVLDARGTVTLYADGEKVASQPDIGLLLGHPADGLSAGIDTGGIVGDYDGEFKYEGELEEVVVESGQK